MGAVQSLLLVLWKHQSVK